MLLERQKRRYNLHKCVNYRGLYEPQEVSDLSKKYCQSIFGAAVFLLKLFMKFISALKPTVSAGKRGVSTEVERMAPKVSMCINHIHSTM